MTSTPIIDWEFVLSTIENGKCILFVGPEAATNAADEMLQDELARVLSPEKGADIISHYKSENLYLFKDAISKTKIYYKIRKFYQDHTVPERYIKLTQIPFHLIITVNPDDLLAHAFEKNGLPVRRLWKERDNDSGVAISTTGVRYDFYLKKQNPAPFDMAIKPHKPVLYNLFGNVENEDSLILTHDDMFDFLISILSHNELPREMRAALHDADDYIFLGFDFNKWYVQLLLRLLKLHNEHYKFARYASNKDLDEQTKQFCREQFKIEFANYDMDEFIEELYSRSKKAGILREKGQRETSAWEQVAQELRRGDIEQAIAIMEGFLTEKGEEDLLDELTGVQSRYSRVKRKISRGVIDEKEEAIALNKITEALIELNGEVKELA